MPWKAVTLDVELDLAEKDEKKPRWQPVRLLFVRGLKELGEVEVSKKDWALFLTTDTKLSMSKMLETYALRWGIEVYFKEANSILVSSRSKRLPLHRTPRQYTCVQSVT